MVTKFLFTFLFSLFVISSNAQQWTLQGADIDGEAVGDNFGHSVSMSADGQTIIIGGIYNDGNGSSSGHAKVFQNQNGSWVQIGSDIDGEAADDKSGWAVSMGSNGQIIAIGAPYNDGNGTNSGHVRVFQNQNGSWVQMGSDIDGEAANDDFGHSISMSADGQTIAIGAIGNDGNGSSSGHVRVFQNQNGSWVQMGSDIDGEAAFDQSGWAVDLSADGQTVIIGSPRNSGNGSFSGQVRVYEFQNNNWVQVGSDIDGANAGDEFGKSVSISSDGRTIAIGAPLNDGNGNNSGHVQIYELQNNNWVQVGVDINGESGEDQSGWAVSLSSNGQIIAIGAFRNKGSGFSYDGHVRVYELQNNSWTQIGADIDAEAGGDQSGYSVCIDTSGTNIIIGARYNIGSNSALSATGHARVYQLSMNTSLKNISNNSRLKVYPNPAFCYFIVDMPSIKENTCIELYDATGILVLQKTTNTLKTNIETNNIPPGLYFIKISTDGENLVQKIKLN